MSSQVNKNPESRIDELGRQISDLSQWLEDVGGSRCEDNELYNKNAALLFSLRRQRDALLHSD